MLPDLNELKWNTLALLYSDSKKNTAFQGRRLCVCGGDGGGRWVWTTPFTQKMSLSISHSFKIYVLIDTCSMFLIIKQIKEMKILKPFLKMYENSYCWIKNHKNIHRGYLTQIEHIFPTKRQKVGHLQKYKLHNSYVLLRM